MSAFMWILLLLAVARATFGRWRWEALCCNDILSSIFGGGQHQQAAPAPTANLGALPSGGIGSSGSSSTEAPLAQAPIASTSNAGLPSAAALGLSTKTPAPVGSTLTGLANQ
jgi:hypothetical protein